MSRIYEALQKAEAEKTSGNPTPLPLREDLVRGYHARAAATALAEPELDTDRFTLPIPETFHSGAGIEPDAVVARPWAPNLAALPALLERGPAVEQFRSLRSRIYELRDIRPMRSILISSGLPQEGKSFVAANLAISLARNRNSRVLLIDGDMRRYTLHKLLGCDPHPGLADYLASRAEMHEVMQRCATPTNGTEANLPGLANLTLIPGGDGGDRASDLSASPRFAELLQTAGPAFDWIIIDSSPVLPVSDAVNYSRAADGVLLVARSGVTEFSTAQQAQAQLKAAHLLGFVLNAVDKPQQTGTYYGYDTRRDEAHSGIPQ